MRVGRLGRMTLRLAAVTFEVPDARLAGSFWSGLLDRGMVDESGGVLLPGSTTQVGLRFVQSAPRDPVFDRLHLHVTSSTVDEQRRALDTAVRLGGRPRGANPPAPGPILYMSDAAGYDFCLIEPGNAYLEGCGPLGEVTCDGSRAGAEFWREALGWNVVWDEGEQLVIQAPAGGTKIAWDGEDSPDDLRGARQRFDLDADDPAREAARLISLGAQLAGEQDGALRLTDPDGGEFTIRRA